MKATITGAMVALLATVSLVALAGAEAAFGPLDEDFRISFTGPDGNVLTGAFEPSIAYNSTADEYLVVWRGDDSSPPLADNEFEIFGQRLSGAGTPLGKRIRVSKQGEDGDASSSATKPSVAYNPYSNEYLVVWQGDVGDGAINDFEIWARRLSASGEKLGGSGDLQLSEMGGPGSALYDALRPSVAANPTTGEYLVVWSGDTPGQGLADDEFEIFGQRVSAEGVELLPHDFRISEQGADGNKESDAEEPSVAYNPAGDEYLVAWHGDIGTGTSGEIEIWAQRLSAAGAEFGGSDFPVSGDGQQTTPADHDYSPSVTANPSTGEYLVAWDGDDFLVEQGSQIFAQLLSDSGARVGGRVHVSDLEFVRENDPSVAYDQSAGEYLIVWEGDGFDQVYGEQEIFAQRLSAAGEQVGENDLRISHMGPDGNANYRANLESVAANPTRGEYLVVWWGDDSSPPLVDNEFEIFGHRLGLAAPMLVTTDPPGPANENNPRVKGNADPDSTVDVFKNSSCLGAPAVNDAAASALNGAGIPVAVADNSVAEFSATTSSDRRTSRCSNSISYTELTPPAPPPPPPTPPPPPKVDVAPIVSGFAVSPRRLRAGGRASFRFRLSERATIRIVIERALPRRKKRFRGIATLSFRIRPAGQNRIVFRGRIGRRALAVGGYRATITATDAAGNRARPRHASFSIVAGQPVRLGRG